MKRSFSCLVVLSTLLTACAASRPKSEAASPQAQSPAASGAADSAPTATSPAPAGYPQQAPGSAYGGQPSAAPPPPAEPAPTTATTSRAVAIQRASSDIESAQRELDVAGSSCQNACRALGSMDRAAGHLCELTREEASHDRCDDAKRRLYGARDRVRSTCGQCPDNQPAVERNAPVPSIR